MSLHDIFPSFTKKTSTRIYLAEYMHHEKEPNAVSKLIQLVPEANRTKMASLRNKYSLQRTELKNRKTRIKIKGGIVLDFCCT